MLLLVHDDEAEILELDAFREQRMRADHDVDVAGRKCCFGFARVLRIHETRELADLQRETAEALAEGLEMLAREKRGRHHDGDLLARHRFDERRAQCDFGLAEADIAADEPIHWPALREVLDGLGDGAFLIVRLLIGKFGAEFVIKALRRIDRLDLLQLARGRDTDQLCRDLAHALLHARFSALPARAAETIKLCGGIVGAVARQQLDVLHRQKQLAAVILQFEAIMRRVQHVDGLQARETCRCRARYG